MRENNKPTRPPTGFIRFVVEAKNIIPRDPSQSYLEWQKKAGEKWNSLTDEQKKVYTDAAQPDFVKYRQELSKWELKMIRMGNTDLVREEAMIESSGGKPKRGPYKKSAASSESD